MRIVAALGIVWAHMEAPWMIEGYVALALFVILAAFLTGQSAIARGGAGLAARRALRFVVPWLVWCAVYLGLEALRARDPARLWTLSDPLWLLVGPMIHLWFLPFLILFTPLMSALATHLPDRRRLRLVAWPGAALGLAAIWLHDRAALPPPLAQWAFAAVPLLYGVVAAAADRAGDRVAPAIFGLSATLPAAVLWQSLVAPSLIAAGILFELVRRLRLDLPPAAALGQLAFGVYLMHPVFMLVWFRLAGADASRAAGAVAVFAASALAALSLRQLRIGRAIV